MSGLTLTQLIALRDAYLEAELAVLKMQSVKVNGVEYTRADLDKIKSERKALDKQIVACSGSGNTTLFATFRRPE